MCKEQEEEEKEINVIDGKWICPYCHQPLPNMFNGDCENCGKIF